MKGAQMKKTAIFVLGLLFAGFAAGSALAVDVDTLDRVSVLMTRAQVISLLGSPDQVDEAGNGLRTEIYRVDGMDPLVGTGCIYEDGRILAGQSFVFRGEMDKAVAERLGRLGFAVLEEPSGAIRLSGRDDDTGHHLVAHVSHQNGMTVVTTFEKGFYDRMVK